MASKLHKERQRVRLENRHLIRNRASEKGRVANGILGGPLCQRATGDLRYRVAWNARRPFPKRRYAGEASGKRPVVPPPWGSKDGSLQTDRNPIGSADKGTLRDPRHGSHGSHGSHSSMKPSSGGSDRVTPVHCTPQMKRKRPLAHFRRISGLPLQIKFLASGAPRNATQTIGGGTRSGLAVFPLSSS